MNTRLFDTIKTMSRSEMKANLAFEFSQIVNKVDFELIKEKTLNAYQFTERVILDVNNKTLSLIIYIAFYLGLLWGIIVKKSKAMYSRLRNLDIIEQKEEEKMQMLELVKDTYELENGLYKDLDKSARKKMANMRKKIKELETSLSLQKTITEDVTKHFTKRLKGVEKDNYEMNRYIEQTKGELYHLRREIHHLQNEVYSKEHQIRQIHTERYQQQHNDQRYDRRQEYNRNDRRQYDRKPRNNNRRYKPSYNKKRENEQRPQSGNKQEYRNVKQENNNMPY